MINTIILYLSASRRICIGVPNNVASGCILTFQTEAVLTSNHSLLGFRGFSMCFYFILFFILRAEEATGDHWCRGVVVTVFGDDV